jgi:hypothetical protein
MGMLDLMNFDVRSLFGGAPKQAAPAPTVDVMNFDPASLTGSSKDVKSIISAAAQRYGVPEDLLHNIAGSESSYKANVANKTGSSAKGLFQFIDSTWRGMGGKPGEQFIPEKNADLGAKYVRQNIDTLRDKLGRDPSYGEVYAAHYFGPGVHRMLTNANPNARIESGLSTFNDRDQVSRIMRQNPNLRGKTVRQVLDSLTEKAGSKYVGGGPRAEAEVDDATLGVAPTQVAQADDSYESAWLDDDQPQAA